MRALTLAAALSFFAFAALQWNDPDPVRWFLIYACAAVVCMLHAWRLVPRVVPCALAAVAVGWAAMLAPSVLRAAAFTGSEEERELGGLLLVAAVCAALARRGPAEATE